MRNGRISDNTIRRLPAYLRALEELQAVGTERITSSQLGRLLGYTASQVRLDLNCFGGFGTQGYGYNVAELRASIRRILGADEARPAILVGAGRIGRALLDNFDFADCGVHVTAAFDTDLNLTDMYYQGVWIYDLSDMERYVKEHPVEIAVLCVPEDAAQRMANYLVGLGVRAIWNFANDDLDIPKPDVVLEDIKFSDSLLELGYRLAAKSGAVSAPRPAPVR